MIALKTHYKRRFRLTIELCALVICLIILIKEWSVIAAALEDIKNSNTRLLLHASLLYWLIVPLTAVSYLLLSPVKLSLNKLILAVIAGSGPGRLVPGGFGLLSIATLQMQRQGLPTRLAFLISATNNFIGALIGLTVLVLSSIINPQPLLQLINQLPFLQILVFLTCAVLLTALFILVRRFKTDKQKQQQDKKQLQAFLVHNTSSTFRLIWLCLIASIILLCNVLILALVARATHTPIGFYQAIVTLSVGVMIGSIIPTPGGVGGVEIGIASALVLLGFTPKDATTIAFGYRFITFFQPLIPGLLAYIYLRHKKEI